MTVSPTTQVRGLVAVLLLLGSSGLAGEQGPAADSGFLQLQQIVRPNDRLTVTTEDGTEVTGRLIDVSEERVVLVDARGERSLPVSQITSIERRKNGVLLGAIVGGAAAPLIFVALITDSQAVTGREVGLSLAAVGLGVGIDAAIGSSEMVYRRGVGTQISLRPILSRDRQGVSFSVRF